MSIRSQDLLYLQVVGAGGGATEGLLSPCSPQVSSLSLPHAGLFTRGLRAVGPKTVSHVLFGRSLLLFEGVDM